MKTVKWATVVVFVLGVAVYLAVPPLAQRIAYAVTKGEGEAAREKLGELSKGDTLSPLFVQVAKAMKPAVVEVRVTKKVKVNAMPDMDQFFQRFFGDEGSPFSVPPGFGQPQRPQAPREFLQRGLGSGVIVDAKNGYVLTNYHVVAGTDEAQVVLSDGSTRKVEWVRTDPQTDLAALKVKDGGLADAPLGDSDAMQVGDWVLAIGSPAGLPQTVTAGIISARGRTTGQTNAYQNFLQTDASINHGNSGGPLVNMKGEIIGINTAIVSEGGGNEGIGFAIPSNMVKNVMQQLIEKGKVTRGYLGVQIQSVNEDLARSFKLPDTKGALVASVMPDSPAAKAGLKPGDFIVGIAGKPVENMNELRNLAAGLPPGKPVPVEFYRDGKKMTENITIEGQPADMTAGATPAPAREEAFGIDVATMSKDLAEKYGYKSVPTGVVILGVVPSSSADNQGLKEGMVITQVQDKDVATVKQFKEAVSAKTAAQGVRLRVMDNTGAARFVFLLP